MDGSSNADSNQLSASGVAKAVVEPYRELTVAAVVLGLIQGIVLNLAFVYVALKLGMGLGGSTVAAIMGYAFLRGVMKKGTMVENNINQTIASGVNTSGSGIVFTVPALYLLDPEMVHFLPLAIAGIAGAILGVAVIIPLRKQMIEMDRLRFPSGVATATIIQAGSSGGEKAKLLAWGIAFSVLWKVTLISGVLSTPDLIKNFGFGLGGSDGDELHFGFHILPDYVAPIVSLSLMNMAAGLLAGRGGLPFFAGGVLSWWVISPIAMHNGWVPEAMIADNGTADWAIYFNMLRPLGIGMLIGGALMGVVMAFPAIKSALRSLATAAKAAKSGGVVGTDELTLKPLMLGLGAGVVLLFSALIMSEGMTTTDAVIATVVGTIWAGLAALIVAQAAGMTDIQPMSGMSLISVTLMLVLLSGNIAGSMIVGVAVCVAIGQGADMMQDLKTGFLIGARPKKQQIIQFCVTWIGALTALWAVHILWQAKEPDDPKQPAAAVADAGETDTENDQTEENSAPAKVAAKPEVKGGFGPGTKLPAPQGAALKGILESLSSEEGSKSIPTDKYALGAGIGLLLGAAPMAGLGVLVGLAMYLPFYITLGYGCGCLLQMVIQKTKGVSFCEHKLVPIAAGLIVGEALTGMGHALYSVLMAG
ncbi:MAG: OPT/YSL family transporter [Planctomycetota bacterium]|nr:OPT/YSL family transporter [Planctomycetota bacterium]MDA1251193.1 OPT/YSL family transporter [Planctomycetota bacterium]